MYTLKEFLERNYGDKKSKGNKTVTLRLKEKSIDIIDEIAKDSGTTRQHIIELIIETYLPEIVKITDSLKVK